MGRIGPGQLLESRDVARLTRDLFGQSLLYYNCSSSLKLVHLQYNAMQCKVKGDSLEVSFFDTSICLYILISFLHSSFPFNADKIFDIDDCAAHDELKVLLL